MHHDVRSDWLGENVYHVWGLRELPGALPHRQEQGSTRSANKASAHRKYRGFPFQDLVDLLEGRYIPDASYV